MNRIAALTLATSLVFAAGAVQAAPRSLGASAPAPALQPRDLVVIPLPHPPALPGATEPMAENQAAVPPPAAPTINWSTGVLRVSGRGRGNPNAHTQGQARAQARSAALMVAVRNLAYALSGAPVTSDSTFREYLRRQGGRLEIHALARYDRIAGETLLPDGSVEITLEKSLHGNRELAEALFGASAPAPSQQHKPVLRPMGDNRIEGLTPADARGPFTGLVIVAAGLKTDPVLCPALRDEAGQLLYGAGVASLEAASQHGLAAYVRSIRAASQLGRVGARPLVVRAIGTTAQGGGDLVLSRTDANRVRAAERAGSFLKNAAVVVVLDAQGE